MSRDAFGKMLLDALEGQGDGLEIVEREDGYVEAHPFNYLAPFKRWPSRQRRALRYARGRILDVGCGGGRVAIHLQERGREVVAIDVSPGAIEVTRRRGVHDARVLSIDDVDESLGLFDTIVMFGNNFGLFGSRAKARRLLRRFHALTTEAARILAENIDPYSTENPSHLAYQRRNRDRGRMSGQLRIRVRYCDHATPWFDYLIVSRDELEELLEGTGWRVRSYVNGEPSLYIAVIEKEPRARASRSG